MNEPRTTLDSDGFAISNGWFMCYCINMQTMEYTGPRDEYISATCGLPGGAYADEPSILAKDGYAICRDDVARTWIYVEDHRGKYAYNKQTRQRVQVSVLGALSPDFTLLAPQSSFDVWDPVTETWVTDSAAERQWLIDQANYQRQALMSEASQEIAVLVDALDPAIISDPSDDDQVKLIAWKAYRVELSKIDQQPSYPDAINWPAKPL
ncbi:tail fiber assembly protein [Aeromonas tecta]|uniref:tail fiber assembly protein n=1 Tax=Aeromonas tecta TaxID=324617 RepID=UPI000683467F|nr:tail assembly chaperone [Aeromonas tecta]